jgi:DNA-binding MarR family transcriptional regulator
MDKQKNVNSEEALSYHIILRRCNEIANQPRFSIMFLLYIHRNVGFTELQRLLELTPGNLDHHLRKLTKLGYVSIRKTISWRPLSIVEITNEGSEVFRSYIEILRKLLDTVD